jgi:prophage regulatory protein
MSRVSFSVHVEKEHPVINVNTRSGAGTVEGKTDAANDARQSSQTTVPSRSATKAAAYLAGHDVQPGTTLLTASIQDVLIRIDYVCAVTGLSVPTIYRLMAKRDFPRPLKITSSARAWKLSEITAWINSREREGA